MRDVAKRREWKRKYQALRLATDPTYKEKHLASCRAYYQKHRDSINPLRRARKREYMAKRRAASEELRAYGRANAKAWAARNRARARKNARASRLRTKYGMSIADFDARLLAQRGLCSICGVLMTPPARRARANRSGVTVDHCHDTGRVRGLLCYECNLGLGVFKDSLQRLRAAVAYLEKDASMTESSARGVGCRT